jgi:hypothetical protein
LLFFFLELLQTNLSYAVEIANPVAAKDKTEYLRDKVVQLFTIRQILEVNTFGTTAVIFLLRAWLHLTASVHGPFTMAALTPPLAIRSALPTIQPAIRRNKFRRTITHLFIPYVIKVPNFNLKRDA